MKTIKAALFTATLLTLSATHALADGYPATPLLSTSKTVMDENISYPTKGNAKVNALIVTIAPGEKTELHQHGVPLFIYVLDGEVTVDYGDRGKKVFKKGDSYMEAMAVDHTGINVSESPVQILAVYMSADGAQDVIPAK